ncbi:MAG: glycosyltransferase family 4 protein [Fibrobacter sp.]|nr:glycosyltransferase family 4 protein [Fibrobacter sp.]
MNKVLHLRSSGGILGAENVILELSKRSSRFGYESHVGAIHSALDPFPEFLIPAKNFSIKTSVFSGNGRVDFKRVQVIKEYIVKNKIDIIHSHGYKENFYSLLLPFKIPKIATNHLWKNVNLKDRFYCSLDSIFLRFFDTVVAVSSEITSTLQKKGISKPVKIPNGIDTDIFKPSGSKQVSILDRFKIPYTSKVIGMVSSLTPEKNHITALHALKNLSNENVILLIVGDGPTKNNLKKTAADLNISEKVIFTGKQSDIQSILSVIDIFILPSLTEGLPMALLEAMSAGKAVIASRVGEIPNIIKHRQNGFLIDARDYRLLAAFIKDLLDNPSMISTIGLNARKDVIDNYSADKMVHQYCRLYDTILKNMRSR